jgi:hypothetical protein
MFDIGFAIAWVIAALAVASPRPPSPAHDDDELTVRQRKGP